jgi:hypothetical protein
VGPGGEREGAPLRSAPPLRAGCHAIPSIARPAAQAGTSTAGAQGRDVSAGRQDGRRRRGQSSRRLNVYRAVPLALAALALEPG